MKVTLLASGSKGNCTLVETGNLNILIDAGITLREFEKRLDRDNISIDIILVTHAHIDHIKGLKAIKNKYNSAVYTRNEEIISLNLCEVNSLEEVLIIKNIEITSFNLSHDSNCTGFIIKDLLTKKELVYITDTGYINRKILDSIVNKNMYIIESNHDIDMLRKSKYPFYLQQRILGDKGHLSNKDCSRYLSRIIGKNTTNIVLAHLSEENNTEEIAYNEIKTYLDKKNIPFNKIFIAKQNKKIEEIEV